MPEPVAAEFLDAEYWDELVLSDPHAALARADRAISEHEGSAEVVALACRARCRALFELGRVADARRALSTAFEAAASVEDPRIIWLLELSEAFLLAEAGDVGGALDLLDQMETRSTGHDLGLVQLQAAYVLHHAGRLNDAVRALDRSELALDSVHADHLGRVRVHLNRGLVLLQQGDLAAAEADLRRAEAISAEHGLVLFQAASMANLGVLHGRARRLPESLDHFERAAAAFDLAGRPARNLTFMEIDRAEVMMHSGLNVDACDAARRALDTAMPSGNATLIGDALLMCARTELGAGHLRAAQRAAERASGHLQRTGRADMTAHADAVSMHATLRQIDDVATHVAQAAPVIDRLREHGWHQQADELTIERIRAAWRSNNWRVVRDDIESLRLHAWGQRRDLALSGWFAEAVARRLDGDLSGAVAACRYGLDFLDEIVSEATTLESRSALMRLGHDLSQWLIEAAVDDQDAATTFAASEGTRARSLHDELGERSGHSPLTEQGAEELREELRVFLGDRCLVQWVSAGSRWYAIVCDRAGFRLVEVGDERTIRRERDRLLIWLDRAAAEPDGSTGAALAAAERLDALLLGPLDLPDDADVVVVPVGDLHGVPWAGLPTLAKRSMVMSPSCRLWLDAGSRATAPMRSIGFVLGPNVTASDGEVEALKGLHDNAAIASGPAATSDAVQRLLSDHDLVHIAAHGRFRADRPLLSTISLADGDATLYDTVPNRIRTQLVILSSCEGGAQGTADGSEVLGLSAVLLARGAAAVLAPLTVVRDLECADFVSDVHAQMATGQPFDAAVASVRSGWLGDDDLSRWAVASSFSCFGSGAVTVATGAD